jgi:signal transduction histidine kinase
VVLIWVEDNGLIPSADRERIFDKFTRLHPRDRKDWVGAGIHRLAVEKHGGQIWVESSDGGGACFKFTLPVAAGDQRVLFG